MESLDTVSEEISRVRLYIARLIALGFVFLVFLVVGEFIVRVLLPQDMSGSWRVYNERGLSLNKDNGSARHQAGQRAVNYRFFKNHLRGSPPLADSVKVLALGDSYTFGWLLDEEDTYVYRLEELARADFGDSAPEFLNGGGGGWGASDYVAFLESMGPSIQPDIVLIFLNFDDLSRSGNSQLYTVDFENGETLVDGINAVKKSWVKRIVNRIPLYNWAIENLHIVQLVRMTAIKLLAKTPSTLQQETTEVEPVSAAAVQPKVNPEELRRKIALGKKLFLRVKAWCDARGIPLLVGTTGFRRLLCENFHCSEVDVAFAERAASFFQENDIPYVDITDAVHAEISGDWEQYIIAADHHANEKGTDVISRHTWRWLKPYIENYLGGGLKP